jgi:nucleotide-binding universal stress UspA family protein
VAHVTSHKLSNSFEGALAGGGDPATSPLYVFGPFLRLVVVAGVARITFGVTIWLVVFTIAMVSAMYRLVMGWVTDGSGGSGLSEEEFGRWAVKVNASITFIEYTLTFLVSMAAMVTFVADRAPVLNQSVLGVEYRTLVAVGLSILIGWLVNRGPKMAARAFGPATAGVLVLLWAMVFASLARFGLRLPDFNLDAFSGENVGFTFAGYARILAVMTGIEVFANLVAAYDGAPQDKSRKAFGSLLIVMGTAAVAMLTVGPAILELSDPTDQHVSVFTQAMDALLPAPLPFAGTLVGVAVLMSASAASAQGLQNLALGLRERNYIPPALGQRNRHEVADKPVWIEVGLVCLLFLAFGADEETYLAIYAAGVFVLLSMTGWAAAKRLLREVRANSTPAGLLVFLGTVVAASLTSAATLLVFEERLTEGAWTYFLFVPILYAFFSYSRRALGEPSPEREKLGEIHVGMLGGFGLGQALRRVTGGLARRRVTPRLVPADWKPSPAVAERLAGPPIGPDHLLVPLDGSHFAEQALPMADLVCRQYGAKLTLVSGSPENRAYLSQIADGLTATGLRVGFATGEGSVTDAICDLISRTDADLVVTSTRGRSGAWHWLSGGVAPRLVSTVDQPVLVIQSEDGPVPQIRKLLVNLDGSEFAERVLPYARALAAAFEAEILLLSVPEIPEAGRFGAAPDRVAQMRAEAEGQLWRYLNDVAAYICGDCRGVRSIVTGTYPVPTIVATAEEEGVDLIMMSTRGRGGLNRLMMGSAAQRVVEQTRLPVFLLPVRAV